MCNSATHYQYFQFGFVGITYFKSFSLKTNDAELSKGLKVKAPKGIHESMKRDIIRCAVIASSYCTLLFIFLVEVVVQKLSSRKKNKKNLEQTWSCFVSDEGVVSFLIYMGHVSVSDPSIIENQPHELSIVYTTARIIWQ